MYNMTVQASNIISAQVILNLFNMPTNDILPQYLITGLLTYYHKQIYRTKDKPLYYTGNKVLLGIAAFNVFLFIGSKIFYVQKNKYVFHCTWLKFYNT